MKSHYETLGIEKSADARQIKRAYFELVKKFPPERFPDEFKEIRAAYDALLDEEKRAAYDEADALPNEVAFLYREAEKARKQGRIEDAIDIYIMILKIHPELSSVRAKYARSLEVVGKTGKAIEAWSELCAREPDNARYITALADCYDMRGWRKKAINAYLRAIEIDDSDVNCWESLIDCHIEGHEFDDVAEISLEAIDAIGKKGKESVYLYSCAAVFGARGEPELVEKYLRDIVRLARTSVPGKNDIEGIIVFLLKMLDAADLMQFYPYVREIADTLPEIEDNIHKYLEKAGRRYEVYTLEEKGFSVLFHDLFLDLIEGCDCEECKLNMAAMECHILDDVSTYRPQLIRLKNEYPQLFSMHAAFFNDTILARDPEKMIQQRLKWLSKHGFSPNFLADREDEERPVQQTVRREGPKTGRNDPCPCGSGKKYKKCCGA